MMVNVSRHLRIHVLAALLLANLVVSGAGAQEKPPTTPAVQNLLFCVPGLPGSRTSAQPYIEKMLLRLAEGLQQPAHTFAGRFEPDAAKCTAQLAAGATQIALLSPALYASLRGQLSMQVVARVVVEGRASEKFFVVTRQGGASSVQELKKKRIVGTQAYDARYVANNLLGGALSPGDLDLHAVKRPLKAVRDVARGKAEAAIIDEATLAALPELEEAASLKVIHTSAEVPPPMVVVIGLKKADERRIQKTLLGLCRGEEGAALCKSLIISAIERASKKDYRKFVRRYAR